MKLQRTQIRISDGSFAALKASAYAEGMPSADFLGMLLTEAYLKYIQKIKLKLIMNNQFFVNIDSSVAETVSAELAQEIQIFVGKAIIMLASQPQAHLNISISRRLGEPQAPIPSVPS